MSIKISLNMSHIKVGKLILHRQKSPMIQDKPTEWNLTNHPKLNFIKGNLCSSGIYKVSLQVIKVTQ